MRRLSKEEVVVTNPEDETYTINLTITLTERKSADVDFAI
jgi:hypothetical protein